MENSRGTTGRIFHDCHATFAPSIRFSCVRPLPGCEVDYLKLWQIFAFALNSCCVQLFEFNKMGK